MIRHWAGAGVLLLSAGFASGARAQDNLSVFLVEGGTGYIGGGTGVNSASPGTTISKTTDGGATWRPQTSGAHNSINDLYFINPDTGWAVGWNPVLKTVDGGGTWTPISQSTGEFYYSVFFQNADTGWIAGNNTLLKTVDGGSVWSQQPIAGCCDSGYTLFSIRFTGADTGYAVGTHYIGIDWGFFTPPGAAILKTTDGGETWNSQPIGISSTLNSVSFGNRDTGWVVGDSGTILHTTNGGAEWDRQSSGTGFSLHSVSFKGTSTGWAVGDSGVVLKTIDGGLHWMRQESAIASNLRSVFLLNANSGLIGGDENTLLKIDQGAVPILARGKVDRPGISLGNGVLRYSLLRAARVKAVLYGADGKARSRLVEAMEGAGEHVLDFSGMRLRSGVYVLRFESGGEGWLTRVVFFP